MRLLVAVLALAGLGYGLGAIPSGSAQVPNQMVREAWPEEQGPGAARRVSEGRMMGQLLERTAPIYPPIAKAAGVSGLVVVRALIGKDGRVDRVMAVVGPEMLRASAEEAVRRWAYKPYLADGEPVRVETTMTVNFVLPVVPERDQAGRMLPPVVRPAPVYPDECGGLQPEEGPHRKVSSGVMQGLLLHRVDPIYPPVNVGGSMVLAVCLSAAGDVEEVNVIAGPPALQEAAVEAVKQWVYRPYFLNGVAVPVSAAVSITMAPGATPP